MARICLLEGHSNNELLNTPKTARILFKEQSLSYFTRSHQQGEVVVNL